MADLAVLAEARGAQVHREPSEPPQLPYATDPSTLTEWLLVTHNRKCDRNSMLAGYPC